MTSIQIIQNQENTHAQPRLKENIPEIPQTVHKRIDHHVAISKPGVYTIIIENIQVR
jgi:hypothetical protein